MTMTGPVNRTAHGADPSHLGLGGGRVQGARCGCEGCGNLDGNHEASTGAEGVKATRQVDSQGRLLGWIVGLPTSGSWTDEPLDDEPLVR